MEVLTEKYPHLKNRKNAKTLKLKISPINIPSNHADKSVVLTREAAEKLIKSQHLRDMPIHYTKKGSELPTTHQVDGKYIGIGHIINNGEIIVEDGVEYLEADVIVHPDTQKEYVEEILSNIEKLGNSWELFPDKGFTINNILHITDVDDFAGNAILDIEHTAFDGTTLMVASKAEEKKMELETIIAEKTIEIEQLKSNIEGLHKDLWVSREENYMLRGIIDLYKEMLGYSEDSEDEMDSEMESED